jgi:hypothetical protein
MLQMIKAAFALLLIVLMLTSCTDHKTDSMYALLERQKDRQTEFERRLRQTTNDPKVGQIGPEGDLNLTSSVSFDELVRESVKDSHGTVRLLNGYATGVLEVKISPHPFKRIAELARVPVTNVNVCGYPIVDEHLADLNNLPVTVLYLAATDVKTLSSLRGNKTLQIVNLGQTPINHEAMVTLSQIPNLHSIDISGTNVDGKDLLLLKNLKSLQMLKIVNCRKIQPADVESLARCSTAKRLHINYSEKLSAKAKENGK